MLPAAVRHDRSLSQTAKLLYAEISSLAQADGYCWATDRYFAELFEVGTATISRCIRQLKDCGYIQVERTKNAKGAERHIYCGLDPRQRGPITGDGTIEGTITSDDRGPIKNDDTPPATQYNENNNNTTGARTREKTDEVFDVLADYAGEDGELLAALVDFREDRRQRKKPMKTALAAKRLTKHLTRLAGGNSAAKIAMLDKAIERGWDSVYALRPDELPEEVPRQIEDAPDVYDWTPGVMPP